MMFHNAILAVSASGQVQWMAENVRYNLCRRLYKRQRKRWWWGAVGMSTLIPGFFLHVYAVAWLMKEQGLGPLTAVGVYAGGWSALVLAFWWMTRPSPHARLDATEFHGMWQTWCSLNELPAGQIEAGFAGGAAAPDGIDPELEDYSFDRVVVCNRREIVDLLIANNFHFENSCAVLSLDGYPEAVFEGLRSMLRRNESLSVYALHDASVEGCRLIHDLRRDTRWFHDTSATLYELGMTPDQAHVVSGCFEPAYQAPSGHRLPGLSSRELKWLERHSAELLALRPAALIRRCFLGIGANDSNSFG